MDTKQAELEISEIKQIMADSRRIMVDDGTGFIVWGMLVFLGLISSYLSIIDVVNWNISGPVWIVIISSGWIYTFFQVRRERKQRRYSTFAGKVSGAIWGSAGVTMTIIGFVGSYSGALKGYSISPMMALVLAAAFFVSGVVYNSRLFRISGICWWIGGIAMMLWKSPHSVLLFALMIFFLQVVPGFVLYSNWKKKNNLSNE